MPRVTGNAREAILDAALDLFGRKGFKATTVKDLAAAVGIKDASLYNHFPSKQAIFDALIQRELQRLQHTLHDSGALFEPSDDASAYLDEDEHSRPATVLASYQPFFEDEHLIGLRHMLTVNQFENPQAQELYREIFIERPIALQTAIFKQMQASKILDESLFTDLSLAALEFHGAVFALLSLELTWSEAAPLIQNHLASFERAYLRRTL